VFSGVTSVCGGLLNAHERFALPALVIAATPLTVIGGAIAFPSSAYGLAWATLIGSGIQAAVSLAYAQRHTVGFSFTWRGMDEHFQIVIRQLLPAASSSLLVGSNVVVDGIVAASLGRGSVSALNYGGKAIGMFLGVTTLAISTAFLPHFSKLVAEHDWTTLRRTAKFHGALILSVSAVITLALIVLSRPLVHFVFQHGAFKAADTTLVTRIQATYLLQAPFYLVGILAVRILHALRRNQLLLVVSMISVTANLLTDVLFSHLMGVAGISLSTSTVYLCTAVVLVLMARHELDRVESEEIDEVTVR
jgi:putative peptidoglycan lipid II flippase